MASNKACRLWIDRLKDLDIEMMAPQHGAVLKQKEQVQSFMQWLENLECGTDLME
jgi:flavorubredoxin